jgi:hypothetical protein
MRYLVQFENYITEEWKQQQVNTWFVLLSIHNQHAVITEFVHYHSYPMSWAINLSLLLGFQGAFRVTAILAFQFFTQYCYLMFIEDILLTWHAFAIALPPLSCWMMSCLIFKPYHGYIPRRNRGMLPLQRALIQKGKATHQWISHFVATFLCCITLLIQQQHATHVISAKVRS